MNRSSQVVCCIIESTLEFVCALISTVQSLNYVNVLIVYHLVIEMSYIASKKSSSSTLITWLKSSINRAVKPQAMLMLSLELWKYKI
jgi:hypothetical protein